MKGRWLILVCCLSSIISVWGNYKPRNRDVYVKKLIKPNSVGIEIGVWQGTFAYNALLQTKPEHLYLVDPWKWPPQNAPKYGEVTDEKELHIQSHYEKVVELFKDHPNVSILRMTSVEASEMFPDNFFDFIYVDGDHSYDGVMADLTHYLPKLKEDGVLIGDDYGFATVAAAVQEFINNNSSLYTLVECVYGQYLIKKQSSCLIK